ncbi:MAG: GNAT family N-acetyltransferase [Rhodospirillales bacterium]|jgi:GNAT superfamily N-acetyltransferase|nr:GNAT family N-acetyltransferase [Rhodospirillales bacterium]
MNGQGIAITHAETAADMGHVRALFVEYQRWLDVDLCFQGFDEELLNLPGAYAPPRGRLLLAREDAAVAGTVGMWPLGADLCEMKRLFVRPPWRGRGLGRRLADAIVGEARAAGYVRMCLDSLERLVAARALYESIGFARIPAYYDNPLEGALFMQLDLTNAV